MVKKERIDKQHRYPWPVIEIAVQMYFEENTTFRSISDKMLEFGVEVSHKTVFEWTQKFSDWIEKKSRKKFSGEYDVEESYVKCNGNWKYLYRAYDRRNRTLCISLRERKSLTVAKSFFKKKLTPASKLLN
jgi:transposase-like protein